MGQKFACRETSGGSLHSDPAIGGSPIPDVGMCESRKNAPKRPLSDFAGHQEHLSLRQDDKERVHRAARSGPDVPGTWWARPE